MTVGAVVTNVVTAVTDVTDVENDGKFRSRISWGERVARRAQARRACSEELIVHVDHVWISTWLAYLGWATVCSSQATE